MKYNIKWKGPGADLQGPTLKEIMKSETKLNEIEHIITKNDKNMALYIHHLRILWKLN